MLAIPGPRFSKGLKFSKILSEKSGNQTISHQDQYFQKGPKFSKILSENSGNQNITRTNIFKGELKFSKILVQRTKIVSEKIGPGPKFSGSKFQ